MLDLLHYMQNIIPKEFTFLKSVTEKNLYYIYDSGRVTMKFFKGKARLFLILPLKSAERTFNLYKIVPYPIFLNNSTISTFIDTKKKNISL